MKESENANRSQIGKRVGIIGIVINFLLATGKLLLGYFSSSVSIIADAANNFTDGASSFVTFLGFKMAERPADTKHPYGHARYEYLAALIVGIFIIFMGIELTKTSLVKISNPTQISFSNTVLVFLGISILVKVVLALVYFSIGKKLFSNVLVATGKDSRNDAITTFVILVAAIIERHTGLQLDGFMGLAVGVFILFSGTKLINETFSPLLGEGANADLQEKIESSIKKNPHVLGCHDLMVHDYGPGKRFASIHVEMDKRNDAVFCHDVLDKIERECLECLGVHLVIHYDPVDTENPELEDIKKKTLSLLQMKDMRISIHDFRMEEQDDEILLIFDMSLPCEIIAQQDEIQKSLERALNTYEGKKIEKNYKTRITFDIT